VIFPANRTLLAAAITGLTLATLLAAGPIRAQTESRETQPSQRVVLIGSLELEDTTHTLIRAVEAQLSDLPVEFAVEWVDRIPENLSAEVDEARAITVRTDALAVFWCDLSRADEVYLYLSNAEQSRILVRRLDTGEKGVRFESLAVIVRSVIDAMLRGGRIGIELGDPAPPPTVAYETPAQVKTWSGEEPAPDDPGRSERDFLLGLQVGYALSGHSSRVPVTHGVDLRLSLVTRVGFEAFAGYVVRLPIAITDRDISIDIETHPAFLGAGWIFAFGRLGVGGGAEVILDFTVQSTRQVATSTAVPRDHRDLIFAAAPYLAGTCELFEDRLALRLQLEVHFVFNPVRYVAEELGDERVVHEPWPIVPVGVIEMVFLI